MTPDPIATAAEIERRDSYPLVSLPQPTARDAAQGLRAYAGLLAYEDCQEAYLAWCRDETEAATVTMMATLKRHGFAGTPKDVRAWLAGQRKAALGRARGEATR